QMVLSHYPPDLILAHLAQMLGKQSPVPAAVASRRRLIERLQDPLLGGRIIFAPLFTRPGSVQKAGNSILGKASQPLAHARRAGLHPCCDLLAVQTIGAQKKDSVSFQPKPFGFSTAHPVQQRLFFLSRELNLGCRSTHSTYFTIITLSYAINYLARIFHGRGLRLNRQWILVRSGETVGSGRV